MIFFHNIINAMGVLVFCVKLSGNHLMSGTDIMKKRNHVMGMRELGRPYMRFL